jgi:hypothetical protein
MKLVLSILALLAILSIPTSLLAVDMGGESGGGSEGGGGGTEAASGGDDDDAGGGSDATAPSGGGNDEDSDPGQVLDPTKDTGFVEPENKNTNINDDKDNNESTLEKCRGDGHFDGINGILNNAKLEACNDSNGNSGVGAYTGGWMSGCLKNHGTVNGVELCSQTLTKVLRGVEFLVDNER